MAQADGNKFGYKRSKLFNSRVIRTQVNDASFTNPTEENTKDLNIVNKNNVPNKLDISKFLAAREYEIKEFELSQLRSRHSSSTRVFQQLPRHMRRRTASHNVRRIPKRLRSKALREMGLNLLHNNNQAKNSGRETKGVDANGRPVKSKHHRGRELYRLRRQAKLLKYAAKHKLTGRLLSHELISAKSINLRQKLKHIREEYNKIEEERENDLDIRESKNDNDLPSIERNFQRTLTKKINNELGSFDNTIINNQPVFNKLYAIKYSTRQRKYKWLPTHKWHAKRAHMIKRWDWSIANAPTMKCFKRTSRNSRSKGLIAWDTSYMSHIILNCQYNENEEDKSQRVGELYKIIGDITNGKAIKSKYLNSANKAFSGFVYLKDNKEDLNEILGEATIVWHDDQILKQLRCLIKIHPANFDRLFNYLLTQVEDKKSLITLHDCRYSLGSIQLTGPKALQTLAAVLKKSKNNDQAYSLFYRLSQLSDPNTIPAGTVFSFGVNDPRLLGRPRTKMGSILKAETGEATSDLFTNNADQILDTIIELKQTNKSVDQICLNDLLTIKGRVKSYKDQPTLKQLGKRKTPELSGKPIPKNQKDPTIPIMIEFKKSGYIELTCPWFWVLPFWMTLNQCPHLSIGGLKQLHQLSFEKGELDPIDDAPFTKIGYMENELKKQELEKQYKRKPKGKRMQYDKLQLSKNDSDSKGEVGNPFRSDWRYLQVLRHGCKVLARYNQVNGGSGPLTASEFDSDLQRVIKHPKDVLEVIKDIEQADEELRLLGQETNKLPVTLAPVVTNLDCKLNPQSIPQLSIIPISFKCLTKGHPKDNARIYLVPQADKEKWLNRLKSADDPKQLSLPPHNLIGFATSATFNLRLGYGSGVGFIDRDWFVNQKDCKEGRRLLLIRNIGSAFPVLATYEEIKL